MSSSFDTFYKTFSGTDTLVFILIPNTKPIVLGSLSTISYSTFRIKKPVPLISEINVSGYTKGIRTVAGTMVFTLINQHWVNELIDANPCDLLIVSAMSMVLVYLGKYMELILQMMQVLYLFKICT